MTVEKVMERIKQNKSGYRCSDEQICDYITTLEHMLLTDVIRGRVGDAAAFARMDGVDFYTNRNFVLLAAPPYDVIYEQYAATQLDLLAEDGDRYMNDMLVFKSTYTDFKRDWWATHRQKHQYRYHE